jgi:hypothetical protein
MQQATVSNIINLLQNITCDYIIIIIELAYVSAATGKAGAHYDDALVCRM